MSRRIQTTSLEGTIGPKIDTYFDRVVKYIPADIVSAWVAIMGIVRGATGIPATVVLWLCFAVGIGITFLWTLKQTTMPDAPVAWLQATVSTVAFIVWVFALGEPFASLSFYHPVYGSLVLIAFTLVSGRVVP